MGGGWGCGGCWCCCWPCAEGQVWWTVRAGECRVHQPQLVGSGHAAPPQPRAALGLLAGMQQELTAIAASCCCC